MEIDLDDFILAVTACAKKPITQLINESEIIKLCDLVLEIFQSQDILLNLIPPVTVCGDIHGQFTDLLKIFEKCGSPDDVNYLFLGDYVDRGPCSIATLCLLFAYKCKYPTNFFLLRGNHESEAVNKEYGFYRECVENYSKTLWEKFNYTFKYMPVAATINNRILCIHAGISPKLKCINDIKQIERPAEIETDSLLCDLLWADPDNRINYFTENPRGVSVLYGAEAVKNFFKGTNFDLIIRSHQHVDEGYLAPFNPNMSVLTIFGVPNYMGTVNNKAAMVNISPDMVCTFTIISPPSSKKSRGKKSKNYK